MDCTATKNASSKKLKSEFNHIGSTFVFLIGINE